MGMDNLDTHRDKVMGMGIDQQCMILVVVALRIVMKVQDITLKGVDGQGMRVMIILRIKPKQGDRAGMHNLKIQERDMDGELARSQIKSESITVSRCQ